MCKDKGEGKMPELAINESYNTPKERFEQSLKELRMIKQKQLPELTWEEMMNDLERDDD